MGDQQMNKMISRDMIRMALGQRPTEWTYGPVAYRRGSPNQKGLDFAARLIYFKVQGSQHQIALAIRDLEEFYDDQEVHGFQCFHGANEQGTNGHGPHWVTVSAFALYGARLVGSASLLTKVRRWWRHWTAFHLSCSTPSGAVVTPGLRIEPAYEGDGHCGPRDTTFRLLRHMPLDGEGTKALSKGLNVDMVDWAGMAMVSRLQRASEDFGRASLATFDDLPVLAVPMTVLRYPRGHVAVCPKIAGAGLEPYAVAWANYNTNEQGYSKEVPPLLPRFEGVPSRVEVRGPNREAAELPVTPAQAPTPPPAEQEPQSPPNTVIEPPTFQSVKKGCSGIFILAVLVLALVWAFSRPARSQCGSAASPVVVSAPTMKCGLWYVAVPYWHATGFLIRNSPPCATTQAALAPSPGVAPQLCPGPANPCHRPSDALLADAQFFLSSAGANQRARAQRLVDYLKAERAYCPSTASTGRLDIYLIEEIPAP